METTLIFQSVFFQNSLFIAQLILVLSILLTFIRFIKGPRAHERIMSFDMIYNLFMVLCITYAIKYKSDYYFDIALVIGLLGFSSSLALAKFLMRGEVIE